ncbi:uncharacterized protein LOC136088583 [Hydra vulgaris]|uniref:Uncharacterized protein LOC136088583 n=1 Tax=Hydra vulgaris TaxID=6087 RepID=A0ABM4D2Z8_HYDVU
MSCLLAFCCSHVPNHSNIKNRILLRKIFFAKLKSTCISLYPSYSHKWDFLFKKLPNNYRQRQFSKCRSLKVKRFPHFSVVNSSINNRDQAVNPILSESVVDKEQLLQDVINEFNKKKPSLSTLSILNRHLFNNKTYSVFPKRVTYAPGLMLEEAIRLYPIFKDSSLKIQKMLVWISPDSQTHTESLMLLQKSLISKKTTDKLFMKVDCDSIHEYLRVPSLYGPQVIYNKTEYGVRSRSGVEMDVQPLISTCEMVVVLMAVYYLLDLTYPSCFGQLLGCLQDICGFGQSALLSKKCIFLLQSFHSNMKYF